MDIRRWLFPVSQASMDRYLDCLVDFRIAADAMGKLVDRLHLLVATCPTDMDSLVEVSLVAFEMVLVFELDKLDSS